MTTTLYSNFSLFDGQQPQLKMQSWMQVNDQTGKIIDIGNQNPPTADQQVDLEEKICHTRLN